jgi:CHAT domain-containing protein
MQPESADSYRSRSPASILFVAANPSTTEHVFVEQEYNAIEQQRRMSAHRDAVRLRAVWATRPLDLINELNRDPPAIVHFAGHGASGEGLLLVDDNGADVRLSGLALRELLAEFPRTTQLVLLNACYSDEVANELENIVGIVIGMPGPIGDRTARAFSEVFYAALFSGRSVRSAFNQAAALYRVHTKLEQATRDIAADAQATPDRMPILRHRPDLDPTNASIVASAARIRRRHRGAVRLLLAAAVTGSLATAAGYASHLRCAPVNQPLGSQRDGNIEILIDAGGPSRPKVHCNPTAVGGIASCQGIEISNSAITNNTVMEGAVDAARD